MEERQRGQHFLMMQAGLAKQELGGPFPTLDEAIEAFAKKVRIFSPTVVKAEGKKSGR